VGRDDRSLVSDARSRFELCPRDKQRGQENPQPRQNVEVEKRRGIKVNFKLSWQVASSNSSLIAVERKADAARPGLSLDQGPPLLR
jgi:hypothetical protein